MKTIRATWMMLVPAAALLLGRGAAAETLRVPNDEPRRVYSDALVKAGLYRLVASGEVSDWDGRTTGVDAVYCYLTERVGSTPQPWQQLRINGKGMNDYATPDLPYAPNHQYWIKLYGNGTPLELHMYDAVEAGSSVNNTGSITVTLSFEGYFANSWNAGKPNWKYSPWFGWFTVEFWPWIYHKEHGFMYAGVCDEIDELFLYTLDMGWIFVTRRAYPGIYRFADGAWLWYARDAGHNPRYFFNYRKNWWEMWE